MPDIKIKKYADKENLKKLMRYFKNTFVNKSEIKELMDQSVDGKLSKLKLDLVQPVSELPAIEDAEEGVLYLVPAKAEGEYDFYAKETVDGVAKFVKNSSLSISGDLDGFLTKADAEATYQKAADLAKVLLGYLPVATAESDYLKKSDASDTYLSKSDASDIYQTKEDLSSQITTSVRSNWYSNFPDGAEAHNAMWGGRDITAAFNNGTFSTNVANGTFRDIFPGDYITKSVTISGTAYTVNWVVADCDYWINKGDTATTAHHVVIVPQVPIFYANMNATNTTEGGYAGSRMYRETIPACATGIVSAFGGDHILTFRDNPTLDLNTSVVSSGITTLTGAPNRGGDWVSVQCNLLSEAMVYDGPHCASSAFDNVMATRQMSAFRLSEKLINYNRQWWWWLRDVVSSAHFASVYGYGHAAMDYASAVRGVRPFALLR